MSHHFYYNILPFDPLIFPNPKIRLPIDLEDLARQIQSKWPISETRIQKGDDGYVHLYISVESFGPLVMATFIVSYGQFLVSVWPEDMAKEMVFWYRQYLSPNYPLFVVVPEVGRVVELPAKATLKEIENILAATTR